MIDIFCLHALYGSSIPLAKYLLQFTKPIFFSGIRMFIAGVVLMGYTYWNKKSSSMFKRSHILLYIQIIFWGAYVKCILRYWGLSNMPAVKMAFLVNFSPFSAALLSYILLKERLFVKQWIGLCIGFIGLIPIFLIKARAEHLTGELLFFSWPELAILGAIFCQNYVMILGRKLVKDENQSPVLVNGIRMLGGGILALMTAYACEEFVPITNIGSFASWLAVLILITHIISYNAYFYMLRYYSATFLSFTEFVIPLFSALYGYLFLHETVSWHYGVSTVVVLFGLYLFYQDELRQSVSEKQKKPIPSQVPRVSQFPVALRAKERGR